MMVIVLLLIAGGVFGLVGWLKDRSGIRFEEQEDEHTALDILRVRYAKSEIDSDEYKDKLRVLLRDDEGV
jgi:uncharacterized membrane protein